jgi:hypothetical protein
LSVVSCQGEIPNSNCQCIATSPVARKSAGIAILLTTDN